MEYRVRYHITCVRAQRALASPLNTLTTREARAPISHAATRTRGTAARPDPRGAGGVTGHTARLDRGPPAFGLLEYGYTRFTELYTRATRWIQDERRSRHLLDTNSRAHETRNTRGTGGGAMRCTVDRALHHCCSLYMRYGSWTTQKTLYDETLRRIRGYYGDSDRPYEQTYVDRKGGSPVPLYAM